MEIEPVSAPLYPEDDVIVNVDDDDHSWMNFAEKLGSASGNPKGDIQLAMIFRVPYPVHRLNVHSFEPKIVSLGPYHRGKPWLRASDERIKLPYASNFFRDITDGNRSSVSVQRIFGLVKHHELDARRVYSEAIRMNANEFVEMMVLDCAFMAEFLLLQRERKKQHGTEMEEQYPWKWATKLIVNDMLVFENQVPLYLLCQVLNEHTRLHNQPPPEFFFKDFIHDIHRNFSPNSEVDVSLSSDRPIAHLLHLFHGWLVSGLRRKVQAFDLPDFPPAEILPTMGIQFANMTNCSSFLDITFDWSKSTIEIPQLVVNDENISLLRNLIAFEQQCHGVGYYVSAYVWFMNYLINTGNDVAVLRVHNIILSPLRSDDEVARIFNDLRRTDAPVVDLDNFYLAEVITKVENRCWGSLFNILWQLWNFSWLKRHYFRNRWQPIVVIAAVFFNFLTLVQTIYAILSYDGKQRHE